MPLIFIYLGFELDGVVFQHSYIPYFVIPCDNAKEYYFLPLPSYIILAAVNKRDNWTLFLGNAGLFIGRINIITNGSPGRSHPVI